MHKKLLFIATAITFTISGVFAQVQTQSPYSKIGLGLMENTGNIVNSGMGGVAVGLFKRNSLNIANPASLSAIDTLTFVLEFGLKSDFSYMTIPGNSKQSFSSNLNYFAFGFRGSKYWTASLGLIPISSRGYRIIDSEFFTGIGDVEKYYIGTGGINSLSLSNSFDIFKNFSAAITTSYTFGRLEETNTLVFADLGGSYNTQQGIKQQISDFSVSFGAHYRIQRSENSMYNIGATFTPKTKLNGIENMIKGVTTGDNLWSVDDNGFAYLIDSSFNKDIVLERPMSLSLGLGIETSNKNTFGFDYSFSNWKSTSYSNTKNAHRLALGMSVIPQWNSAISYFKRSTYRFGAFFESTNLTVSGTDIPNFGVATGIGFPIRRGLYNLDIDFQVGQMGTNANNQIKDYFAKMSLKIRFSEIWFYKPKYD